MKLAVLLGELILILIGVGLVGYLINMLQISTAKQLGIDVTPGNAGVSSGHKK